MSPNNFAFKTFHVASHVDRFLIKMCMRKIKMFNERETNTSAI